MEQLFRTPGRPANTKAESRAGRFISLGHKVSCKGGDRRGNRHTSGAARPRCGFDETVKPHTSPPPGA
jgi:hypothetical protein